MDVSRKARFGGVKPVFRAGLVVLSLAILIIVALPNTGLAWIRHEYRWIGNSVNWVEGL